MKYITTLILLINLSEWVGQNLSTNDTNYYSLINAMKIKYRVLQEN